MLKRTLLSLTFCTLWLTCGCGPTSANAPRSSGHVRADPANLAVPTTAATSESRADAASPFLLQWADATDNEPGGIQLASADGDVDRQKKKEEELVTARVLLEYDKLPAGDVCRGLILLNVKAGWHINTNPAKPDFLIPTTVSVKSKQKTKMSDVTYPKGKELSIPGFEEPLHVYEGSVRVDCNLTAPLIAAGQVDELEIQIRYQPCNDTRCLAPKTISLKGKVPVTGVGEAPKPINDKYFREPEKKQR